MDYQQHEARVKERAYEQMKAQANNSIRGLGEASDAPRSEMNDEFNRMNETISRLESTVSALNARLGPVIRPVPVAALKEDSTGGGMSPLGSAMRDFSTRVGYTQHQLGQLLDSLSI